MKSFSDVIAVWETVTEFAQDMGVQYVTAHSWKQRNSLPSEHWAMVVKKAVKRGHPEITLELLAYIAKKNAAAKAKAAESAIRKVS